MSDVTVRVQDLSKLYRIGERQSHDTLRDLLAEKIAAPFRRRGSSPSRGDSPKQYHEGSGDEL